MWRTLFPCTEIFVYRIRPCTGTYCFILSLEIFWTSHYILKICSLVVDRVTLQPFYSSGKRLSQTKSRIQNFLIFFTYLWIFLMNYRDWIRSSKRGLLKLKVGHGSIHTFKMWSVFRNPRTYKMHLAKNLNLQGGPSLRYFMFTVRDISAGSA